jgi:hypothetical protein
MLHQKAPHRAWEPATRHIEMFKDKVIPEPETLWDDYATRPTALPINEQTIARDLTRRDLKLTPPADLKGPELQKWMQEKPMELEVDGKLLTGKELVQWKYQKYMRDYLACVQGVDDGVGKGARLPRRPVSRKTPSSSTPPTTAGISATSAFTTNASCTNPACTCPLLAAAPASRRARARAVRGQHRPRPHLPRSRRPARARLHAGPLHRPAAARRIPADWRTSVYYRYYHDPGHHNTVAHLGVRTATHKLIHYWKQDAYELFDLTADPTEQRNLCIPGRRCRAP